MDNITTDYMITLADLSEDALYQLYNEAISKLRSKDISTQDRKKHLRNDLRVVKEGE